MYIFTVNSFIFWQHSKWYSTDGKFPKPLNYIATAAKWMSYVDFAFIFIIFCIYYPLGILWLYIAAVTIMIMCPLIVCATIYVAPLITLCLLPGINIFIYI